MIGDIGVQPESAVVGGEPGGIIFIKQLGPDRFAALDGDPLDKSPDALVGAVWTARVRRSAVGGTEADVVAMKIERVLDPFVGVGMFASTGIGSTRHSCRRHPCLVTEDLAPPIAGERPAALRHQPLP